MDHRHEPPLCIDFLLASVTKSLDADHFSDVTEHGLDYAKSLTIIVTTFFAIDFIFHPLDDSVLSIFCNTQFDIHLTWRALLRVP